jgi:hypothetical protein
MSALITDAQLRRALSSAGHTYWSREHTMELMAEDYRRVMRDAATLAVPRVEGLPSHFTADYSWLVRRISEEVGVDIAFPGP